MKTKTTPATEFDPEKIRNKYLQFVKTIGIDQTLSMLHNELGKLEIKIFDGGYEKKRLMQVQVLRAISRELWTLRFDSKAS